MRDFLLVVPDLVLAAAGADVDAEQGDVDDARAAGEAVRDADALPRLRFGPARALPRGWRAWLAERLGRPDLDALAPAAVVAGALAPPVATRDALGRERPPPWLATPLHLVAGLDTVHLPRDGILQLAAGERAELAASFESALGGAALRLLPSAADAFVLDGLDVAPVAASDPLECLGGDLVRAQPVGAGAAPLRRLMAEIEMWLHDHPVNRARAARGAPAVRSLWLWGASAPQRPAPSPDAAPASFAGGATAHPAAALRVHSDDAWVRAAAGLAGVAVAPEDEWPDTAAFDGGEGMLVTTARLHGEARGDRARFEQRHLAPALAALRSGRLRGLTIASADRVVRLEAGDRWRLWRPRRTWLGALGV